MKKFLVNFTVANGTKYELTLQYTGPFTGDGFNSHDTPPSDVAEIENGIVSDGIMEYESIHEFAAEYGCEVIVGAFDSDPGN